MTAQLPLFPRPRDAEAFAVQMAALVSLLSDGLWHTRREIERVLGIPPRTVRRIRQSSDGAIIMGQHGFKLRSAATEDEIAHAANQLESQAREMLAEAVALRNRAHRRIAG